jgi:hypothetical protein
VAKNLSISLSMTRELTNVENESQLQAPAMMQTALAVISNRIGSRLKVTIRNNEREPIAKP